jgi:hypothetical protein
MERLLRPDFIAISASGRVWDRARILELLAGLPPTAGSAPGFAPVAGRRPLGVKGSSRAVALQSATGNRRSS